jgi:hypothetical protein
MAARMAMIAMTTSNSIKVKADFNGLALTPLWENARDWPGNPFLSDCPTLMVMLWFIMFLFAKPLPTAGDFGAKVQCLHA